MKKFIPTEVSARYQPEGDKLKSSPVNDFPIRKLYFDDFLKPADSAFAKIIETGTL